jgi:hypothetical protein
MIKKMARFCKKKKARKLKIEIEVRHDPRERTAMHLAAGFALAEMAFGMLRDYCSRKRQASGLGIDHVQDTDAEIISSQVKDKRNE